MIIKRLKFHNFRNFYGDQEIEFAYDGNKNVTIILGENTYGKTTIIASFIWCFYGESRLDKKDDILNNKVQRTMIPNQQETVSVEVDFLDNDIPYNIKRTAIYKQSGTNKVSLINSNAVLTYIDTEGKAQIRKHDSDINEIMYTILPMDLSEFFFFEGEKNNNLPKRELKKAVNTLLGLTPFEKMLGHLYGTTDVMAEKSVIGQFTAMCAGMAGNDTQELQNEITELQEKLENVNNRLREIVAEKSDANNKINKIDSDLKAFQEVRILSENRKKLEIELNKDIELLKKSQKTLLNLFNQESLCLIMSTSFDKVEKRFKKLDLQIDGKAITGIDGSCIKELLKRGKCLCGQSLKPGSEHYKIVEQYIDILPPQSLGLLIKDLQDTVAGYKAKQNEFKDNFEEEYREIVSLENKIDDIIREMNDISVQIAQLGNPDIESLENERKNLINIIDDLDNEYPDKCTEQANIDSELKTKSAELDKKLTANYKVRKYKKYLDYASEIYYWLKSEYQKKEDSMRGELELKIKDLFDQMYTGHRDVTIDDNYNIVIKHAGSELGETGGLRIIKYFAYVGGIVALANEKKMERAKKKDNILSDNLGEDYPLVLDAAFSHADTVHTKNISKTLSENVTQLIFALMSKDWANAKEGLQNKVGKIYKLIKISDDEAKIEEA